MHVLDNCGASTPLSPTMTFSQYQGFGSKMLTTMSVFDFFLDHPDIPCTPQTCSLVDGSGASIPYFKLISHSHPNLEFEIDTLV